MHGHNWKVEVEVCGNKLDNIGMVIDFKEIRNLTKSVVDQLDHQFLNDLKPFKEINPTAENAAFPPLLILAKLHRPPVSEEDDKYKVMTF